MADIELYVTPIDFLVFGFIVTGGACGLPLISLIEEFAVKPALICCDKNLLWLSIYLAPIDL